MEKKIGFRYTKKPPAAGRLLVPIGKLVEKRNNPGAI